MTSEEVTTPAAADEGAASVIAPLPRHCEPKASVIASVAKGFDTPRLHTTGGATQPPVVECRRRRCIETTTAQGGTIAMTERGGYRAVIFDFDGTLYEQTGLARRLVLSSLPDALTMRAERCARKSMLGTDLGSMAGLRAELFKRMSAATGKKTDVLERWYNERYLPLIIQVLQKYYKARPNADCLLESLRVMGVKTAVLSDYPNITDRLRAIGLTADMFDATLSAEEIGALKPCARPFVETAKCLGVPHGECLVVGDRSDTDGDGARACGMDFIRIASEHRKSDDDEKDKPILWEDFSRYALVSV